MRKNKLLLLLALLLTAATGAWAQTETLLVTIENKDYESFKSGSMTFDDKVTVTFSNTVENDGDDDGWYIEGESLLTVAGINGYTITSCKFYTKYGTAANGYTIEGESPSVYLSGGYVFPAANKSVNIGVPGIKKIEVYGAAASVATGYSVTMKEGTVDAKNWSIASGEKSAKGDAADGLTGLSEGDKVTLQYNGRLKVKGVKATSEAAASSFTEVTTFSELQTALSAGKDVKLMNDIDCTAEINITSDEPLTIDGNGKKLSTTSAIRAFKVGSSATVAFKDLTLTGFVSGGGPAINNSGTIVLDGCTISNCHVNNTNGGGAIENKSGGKLYAINTTFSGNYSGEIGGAINNYMGSLYMSGCTFTDNYTTMSNAYWGGAIGINGGDEVRLINCSFSGNKYGTNAGTNDIGVYNNPTNYTIAGCTGVSIASRNGDITTIASGTATLDYSDLSNISFTVEQAAKPAAVTYIGTKSPTEAKAVGDIVFSDGSATAYTSGLTLTDEQKAAAVAVIFYAGSASDILGAKTLGVGLKNTNDETTKYLAFARNASGTAEGYNTNITAIQCTPSESGDGKAATATFTGDLDGSDNWTALCAAVNDEGTSGNYPAWEWVNAYATTANLTGEYASGWYLPTVAELCMLYRAKDTVNAALEKADGTIIVDNFYWSSSQSSSTNNIAWMVKFDIGKLIDTYKGNKWYVCGVRAFN